MSPGGSVNTTTVVFTALHIRNAETEGAHIGRGAHFTRPSLNRLALKSGIDGHPESPHVGPDYEFGLRVSI